MVEQALEVVWRAKKRYAFAAVDAVLRSRRVWRGAPRAACSRWRSARPASICAWAPLRTLLSSHSCGNSALQPEQFLSTFAVAAAAVAPPTTAAAVAALLAPLPPPQPTELGEKQACL
jgi:hypothetical protein